MRGREPKWIPILTGASIVSAWTAAVIGIAFLAVWGAGFDLAATIIVSTMAWWMVAGPVVKLVRADLKSGSDGR
ncbi:putative Hemolysin III [Mycolicibacterium canariasense]|uniref:Putative Hemolysin III n=1 Tax=Mycolicibacterium canariasense TaxID=228230 RepID=A0A124E1Q3_MYCCR|nr:hypothetical protein [Mycolicibacterium canariasense]MCV7208812.1 hypothetical protein [Mycolicibacterium canariasense]ORV07123.1 hypothetical protein AWB94_14065 [Mycolicibacterium canariasense]GAS94400.1 putative Hemolysin III [Mycolicibacterium canariasense]